MQATETQDAKKNAVAGEQGCGPKVQPQKEHEWLQKLAGEWTCEGEASMGPDKPTVKWKATEVVRPLGAVWIVAEGQGEMPGGGQSITMVMLGYDPQKRAYVGVFAGSMMTNLWVYEGQLDASGTVLTLDTEGPSMTAQGKLAKYRDIIEMKSKDQRRLTSEVLGDDGQWIWIMTANYTRTK
jgi:hypothetical protein